MSTHEKLSRSMQHSVDLSRPSAAYVSTVTDAEFFAVTREVLTSFNALD